MSAARIWLACHTNYAAVPTGPYDEELQVRLGLSLASGKWLGAYNQYTLIKGIVYPLFLAFCGKIGITYGLGLGLLMVLAALVFQAMLGLVNENRILRGCCFAWVLYDPVAMTSWSGLRIYRDALGPWLMLLLAAQPVLDPGLRRTFAGGLRPRPGVPGNGPRERKRPAQRKPCPPDASVPSLLSSALRG